MTAISLRRSQGPDCDPGVPLRSPKWELVLDLLNGILQITSNRPEILTTSAKIVCLIRT